MKQFTLLPKDINRFLSKINIQKNECWTWLGGVTKKGSGAYVDNMPVFNLQTDKVFARRIAYFIYFGNLPQAHIYTTCGNSLCLNPNHLTLTYGKTDYKIFKTRKRRKINLKLIEEINEMRLAKLKIEEIADLLQLDMMRVQLILKMIRLCKESKLPIDKELPKRIS
jgi:hypothetical protein